MSMATAHSLSSPSCFRHCTKPTSRFSFRSRIHSFYSSSSTVMAAAAATTTTKVIPAVIVGGGRVGKAPQDMGTGDDFLVKRGESVPLDFSGPILMCTRNDDLEFTIQKEFGDGRPPTWLERSLTCTEELTLLETGVGRSPIRPGRSPLAQEP